MGWWHLKALTPLAVKIPNSFARDILAGYHVCFIAGGLCLVTFPKVCWSYVNLLTTIKALMFCQPLCCPVTYSLRQNERGQLHLTLFFFLLLAHLLILPMLFIILTHQILHTNIARARSQHSVPTMLTETSLWQRKQESVSCAVDDVFPVSWFRNFFRICRIADSSSSCLWCMLDTRIWHGWYSSLRCWPNRWSLRCMLDARIWNYDK